MAQSELGRSIVTGVGVAASDRGGGYSTAMLASMVNNLAQLRFGRKDESEADEYGLRIMTESGFDPRAMIDVMKVLEASSKGGHPPEFMVTHPYPEHRIEAIERWLNEHPDQAKGLTRGRKLH
jgi:predicted Zn-dependent protease